MYSKGHAGLTLACMSLLMIPFGFNEYALIVIGIATGLSALPDIDMKWRKYKVEVKGKKYQVKHRGKQTHSLFFALIIGVLLGALFLFSHGDIYWSFIGFLGGFFGVASHLLGDVITYHEFQPLYPFSDRLVAYGFCGASDKIVNEGLMTAGVMSFISYFLISTGVLSEILVSFI